MKILKCIVFILLAASNFAYSQKVVKIVKDYALINLNESSNLKKGDIIQVSRRLPTGDVISIGTVQIEVFKDNKCGVKIIKENAPYRLQIGDFISLSPSPGGGTSEAYRQPESSNSMPNLQYRKANQTISYLAAGTGALGIALGFYFNNQANNSYDDYNTARISGATFSEINRLSNDTHRWENQSNFCFGLGGGLVVFGVTHFIWKKFFSNNNSSNTISMVPFKKHDTYGFGLQVCLNSTK